MSRSLHTAGELLDNPFSWYFHLAPKEPVLVTPVPVGGLASFVESVRRTHEAEPYVQLRVLLLD